MSAKAIRKGGGGGGEGAEGGGGEEKKEKEEGVMTREDALDDADCFDVAFEGSIQGDACNR